MLSPRNACRLVFVFLASACTPEPAAPPPPRLVYASQVADASGFSERTFPGRAQAGQEVNLSFRVGGPLITLPVDVGDEVRAGDVVARIDPQDYETALRSIEAQLAREEARRTRAESDLDRLERIRRQDPGATSQLAIDRALQLRDSARASVASLEASVETARDRLSYTELKAPFGGVVVETYAENFETVIPKQPILRLLDPSAIEFVINVPENLIGLSRFIEKITVEFDAAPAVQIDATVKELGKEASRATRTYPVTLALTPPDGVEILPGMAGNAAITGRAPEDSHLAGIQIPATAVFAGDDPSKSYVWVIDEASKTLSRREVEVGQLATRGVLVKSGLQSGEWIVTKGVHSVDEGDEVRIFEVS